MKLKYIAAAALALCSSGAFAATAKLVCSTANAPDMVNTCAPEATLYIAGSSAMGSPLSTVVAADLFDTSTTPMIKIKDTASPNGLVGAVSAWYGMSKAALTGGVSKRLFVVYNNQNGSAAGVSQLLAKLDGKITEADVVTVGPVKGVAGSCTADGSSTTAVPVLNCASHALTQADMAISDVAPNELYKLYATATAKLSTLNSVPLALQGFGVAVNQNLYNALQTQNIADGLLPATCVAGDATAACQPSIRRADYASLVTKVGSIKSAAGLFANDATVLTLARRDDLSGTQASSNIFFADNACGVPVAKSANIGGALDIISLTDSTAALVVQANATGGGVKTALNSTSGYAIGVISLTTGQPTTGWKFIKIDGVSPTFNADGTAAYKQRTAFATGNYPFAMTAFAVTPVKQAVGKPALTTAVIGGLKDSTLHDLVGIAYLDGAANDPAAPKQAMVHRYLGNNCSPLIK